MIALYKAHSSKDVSCLVVVLFLSPYKQVEGTQSILAGERKQSAKYTAL